MVNLFFLKFWCSIFFKKNYTVITPHVLALKVLVVIIWSHTWEVHIYIYIYSSEMPNL